MIKDMPQQTLYLKEEWHARRVIMETALEILSDGQSHSSIQLLEAFNKRGITLPKRLINSVLFSEARRYVFYDKKTFTYRLRQAESEELDSALQKGIFEISPESEPVKGEVKARYIGRDDEYIFSASQSTGPAFFNLSARSRTVEIILNHSHPLFPYLETILDTTDIIDCKESEDRLQKAKQVLEVILAAWAKYESNLPDGPRKHRAEEARMEWGRDARILLMDDDLEDVE